MVVEKDQAPIEDEDQVLTETVEDEDGQAENEQPDESAEKEEEEKPKSEEESDAEVTSEEEELRKTFEEETGFEFDSLPDELKKDFTKGFHKTVNRWTERQKKVVEELEEKKKEFENGLQAFLESEDFDEKLQDVKEDIKENSDDSEETVEEEPKYMTKEEFIRLQKEQQKQAEIWGTFKARHPEVDKEVENKLAKVIKVFPVNPVAAKHMDPQVILDQYLAMVVPPQAKVTMTEKKVDPSKVTTEKAGVGVSQTIEPKPKSLTLDTLSEIYDQVMGKE